MDGALPPLAPYMPFHPIYSTDLSFLKAICYFTEAAMCFTYAHVSAYAHTSDSLTVQLGSHPYMHPGDMISPVAICLRFLFYYFIYFIFIYFCHLSP